MKTSEDRNAPDQKLKMTPAEESLQRIHEQIATYFGQRKHALPTSGSTEELYRAYMAQIEVLHRERRIFLAGNIGEIERLESLSRAIRGIREPDRKPNGGRICDRWRIIR